MALVKQFSFETKEVKNGKNTETKSIFTAAEMVEKAIVQNDKNIQSIWVSHRDTDETFVSSTGNAVYPKGGVPTGQVWLFVTENENSNVEDIEDSCLVLCGDPTFAQRDITVKLDILQD